MRVRRVCPGRTAADIILLFAVREVGDMAKGIRSAPMVEVVVVWLGSGGSESDMKSSDLGGGCSLNS